MKIKLILALSVFFSLLVIQTLSKAGYCSEWWMLLPIVLGLIVLVWGVVNINSQMFVKTECHFTPEGSEIMLTFDDGPDPVQTPKLLDLLDTYEAKGIFFFIGKKMETYPEMVKIVSEKGHEIGSHSYSHGYGFDFLSAEKVKNELLQTEKIIKRITGKKTTFFRPPYGITNPNIAKALQSFSYRVLGWNIRSFDTVIQSPEKLEKRVLKRIKPGSIILMHDTASAAPEVLERILIFMKEKGFSTRLP